jgi:glycine cleavage system aminomethyltransferase T
LANVNRRVQLTRIHEQTATMTNFAGFEMPLFYEGIIPEHLAVRNNVGVFDISHMGRVVIAGADAESFLNYVITNDVSKLSPNTALYSVMCTERGGIIDDLIIYRLDAQKFMAVFNASNRQKDNEWMISCSKSYKVTIEEISDDVAMFALQYP